MTTLNSKQQKQANLLLATFNNFHDTKYHLTIKNNKYAIIDPVTGGYYGDNMTPTSLINYLIDTVCAYTNSLIRNTK